ncbi:hypothetical protein H6G00_00310 [Leptolyngbya sp. FACHB-541]|uniref:hypothetical protein n=1 Tax=Leptolyngbya sp. FACHB-541 TaxID=2692810 RepID=UPI00168854D4|nr:hypothetical protein [Leptolyngbya sp. FACHB-541]MBD1995071.1 hypothetical protein [Leptolyngbya sp. FACHB-541]
MSINKTPFIASFSELLCTTKVSDIEFDADGNAYAIIGLASNPANRDSLQVLDFSQLIAIDRFDGGSSWTRLRDFSAYEQNNNPDKQDVNTNLFAQSASLCKQAQTSLFASFAYSQLRELWSRGSLITLILFARRSSEPF